MLQRCSWKYLKKLTENKFAAAAAAATTVTVSDDKNNKTPTWGENDVRVVAGFVAEGIAIGGDELVAAAAADAAILFAAAVEGALQVFWEE